MSTFYLGTDMPGWLATMTVPLFVSHRRLAPRKHLRRSEVPWALDSGGFTELHQHGGWNTTPLEYADAVHRYNTEVGCLEWVAPQDWMCEPSALAASGLTVEAHQALTVGNYIELRDLLGELVVPVLQGWSTDDYLAHVDQYAAAGVQLDQLDRVGLGSVCRRDQVAQVVEVITELQPIRLHAFGIKGETWGRAHHMLASADSMAWSFTGRDFKMPHCTHRARTCSHCPAWALRWRRRTLAAADQLRLL